MKNITLALIAVVAVVAGCGPKEEPLKVTADQITPEAKFVNEMKAKAGGDINNLTPEERKKMDEITRGNTELVLSEKK